MSDISAEDLAELKDNCEIWKGIADDWKAEAARLREREAVLVEMLAEAIGPSEFRKLSRCIQQTNSHRDCGGYDEGCPFHQCPMRDARQALATLDVPAPKEQR